VTAALEGTQEIDLAVAATTFTIMAVFLPVAIMGGIVGRFFCQFGVTVTAAAVISTFVSFTLDPMLSSVLPDPDAEGRQARTRVGRFLAWGGHLLDRLAPGIRAADRVGTNADGRPVEEVSDDIAAGIAQLSLEPEYRLSLGGAGADIEETTGQASVALVLAVVFIDMILASQFASFLQPLAIMASLPLSLVGVLLALLVTGSTINMFSIIGFILLMGLVNKNAILLVDFIQWSVTGCKDRTCVIIEAGGVRLRPILMTTFAMVFGMLPLAPGPGSGSHG
jgi:multidrug efflux pump subunit AcrB